MADTKKNETASSETDRTEEELVSEAQPLPEEDGLTDDSDSYVDLDEAVEDAEVVDETGPGGDEDGAFPEAEDEPLILDNAVVEDATDDMAPDASDPDDDTIDEEDVADLQSLDGVDDSGAAEVVDEGDAASADDDEAAGEAEQDDQVDREPETEPEPPRTIEKETVVVEKKGGMLGGFVGGVVASLGIVFAAPYVIPANMMPFNTSELEAELDGQVTTLKSLEDEIAALRGQISEAATAGQVSALQSETEGAIANVEAALADLGEQSATKERLDETAAGLEAAVASIAAVTASGEEIRNRIVDLEKRPIAEATDPAAVSALKAYEREVAELRESVTAQMERSEELVATATASAEEAVRNAIAASDEAVRKAVEASDAAMADAAEAEALAQAKATRAAQAQALVDIQSALDSGEAFAGSLAALEGLELPDTLSGVAEEGVSTLPELQDGYVVAAREALDAARRGTSGTGVSDRVGTFMQTQLGIRSLAPREGDDPDAVLSRAEAAVREGRLTDAVAELEALPEGARTLMTEWVARATARAEALAAADELAASLAAQ